VRIVIFNWRDLEHPQAGGAERSTHTLAAGLALRGHSVTWFTSRHRGSTARERRAGYDVVRFGNQLTCRVHALLWLRAHSTKFDVVIDEVNTLPFFSTWIFRPVVLWIHQIAKEVWLKEAPAVVGQIGYRIEPWLMSVYREAPVATVSQSSAASLEQLGLRGPVHVIENALRPPVERTSSPKYGRIGYVGRLAPSKRVDDIIRAVAIVRRSVPQAQLFIVGRGDATEERRLAEVARRLSLDDAVVFCGQLSDEKRDEVLDSLDVLAMASVREGWGLVVSEAARFGVPSAVYPVAGLVDSVQHGETGLVSAAETPEALASCLLDIIKDRAMRARLGAGSMRYIEQFSKERFVSRFEALLQDVISAVS
jgi:glycosyltransferase involved in cell wall biosynthesis